MAVLPDGERFQITAEMQRDDRFGTWNNLLKADLRAAVNALDAFLSDNATTINQAIPQPARSNLTTTQKALLLVYVISRRYLAGV